MSDLEKEEWVELFQLAVMELERAKMTGRVRNARTAISARIAKLRTIPGLHQHERELIDDALRTLRYLEQEEEHYQTSEKRRLLDTALASLKSIAPKIGADNPSDAEA